MGSQSVIPQVLLKGPQDQHLIFANVHTVDGQGDHAVPGKDSAAKHRFKANCVANVVNDLQIAQKALASTQGHKANILLAGDLNTNSEALKEALADAQRLGMPKEER